MSCTASTPANQKRVLPDQVLTHSYAPLSPPTAVANIGSGLVEGQKCTNQRNKVDRITVQYKPVSGKATPISVKVVDKPDPKDAEASVQVFEWDCAYFSATFDPNAKAKNVREFTIKENGDPTVNAMIGYVCLYYCDPNGIREASDPDFPYGKDLPGECCWRGRV